MGHRKELQKRGDEKPFLNNNAPELKKTTRLKKVVGIDETLSAEMPGWPGKATRNFRFRGNTLCEISPPVPTWPDNKGNWWLYQGRAQKYQVSNAPMIEVKRFSTPLSFKW